MKLKIENKSSRPDAILIALAEFAAKFFPHRTGVVRLLFVNSRDRSHGYCYGRSYCKVYIGKNDELCKGKPYPATFEEMHYFRHANQSAVKPLTVNDWKEHILSIIAHELEHTTIGNAKMRRSRQEIGAWNRSVQVVEASRTPEAQSEIQARYDGIRFSEQSREQREKDKKTPESKIIHLQGLMQKWERKAKLAKTKIRKLKTRIKYFERKAAASK